MLRKLALSLAALAAATASCYLGYLTSLLVWEAPRIVVTLFSDSVLYRVVVRGGVPRLAFLPSNTDSILVYGLSAFGSLAAAGLVLLWAVRGLPRLRGAWRLWATFTVFWLAMLVLEAAAISLVWRRGSLATLLRVIGLGDFAAPAGLWLLAAAVAGAALAAVYRGMSAANEPAGSTRKTASAWALWFVLAVGALSVLPSGVVVSSRWLRRLGLEFAPALIAFLLVAVMVWRRSGPAPSLRTGVPGGAATVLASLLAWGAVLQTPRLVPQPAKPVFESRQSRHWQLYFEEGVFASGRQEEFAAAADRRAEQIAERLGVDLDGQHRQMYVYVSADAKRSSSAEFGSDEPFTLDPAGAALHQLLDPEGELADRRGEASVLLRSAWGEAGSERVALAIARYAVGTFHGRDLATYARQIGCEEQPYSLAQVLHPGSLYLSPLVRDVFGGAWVESLVQSKGRGILRDLYQAPSGNPDPRSLAKGINASWPQLEEQWQSALSTEENCEAEPTTDASAQAADPEMDHRGISFSHEYGGSWGYGSDVSGRQLEIIRDLGANAVAVVPYSFTRAPEETWIRFRTDETDARVIRAIQRAKRLGLRVMLKPHLWARRFTGEIAFDEPADFEEWFSQYRRWLLHFARVAELYDVELLALGNELGGLTSRETEWRELIREVRRIYHGPLTYAANWDGEFEAVRFWDALDYAGVNFYYPLAAPGETPRRDSPRMRAAVESIRAVSKKFGKPVLLTEVGFPATSSAAAEPWRETHADLDAELQARCYQVVFEAFAGRPWLAGMYWWKWPTHGWGGPFDDSYSPINKPAARVLRHWYQQPMLLRAPSD